MLLLGCIAKASIKWGVETHQESKKASNSGVSDGFSLFLSINTFLFRVQTQL